MRAFSFKSAAYTVTNADDGALLCLGGAALYALTFGPLTDYDPLFCARVHPGLPARCCFGRDAPRVGAG